MLRGTHSQPDPYQTVSVLCLLCLAAFCPFVGGDFGKKREGWHKQHLKSSISSHCLTITSAVALATPALPQLASSLMRRCKQCVVVVQVNSFLMGLLYLKIGTPLGLHSARWGCHSKENICFFIMHKKVLHDERGFI